eukprot:CAMPEP_0113936110 /NCGR_PEP_ID=MMETSP1339-20121228/3081_1 /TAXON_ID=94617 /ORGANISM="Fibrocapsa japonica" /LENGTH=427 /DNA_ID=CAMNT_0000938453 /DNA_START=42 /DNA_END=1325 /DNA_ORIENTATION=- /assembly_acc=CAM_ASM_000762
MAGPEDPTDDATLSEEQDKVVDEEPEGSTNGAVEDEGEEGGDPDEEEEGAAEPEVEEAEEDEDGDAEEAEEAEEDDGQAEEKGGEEEEAPAPKKGRRKKSDKPPTPTVPRVSSYGRQRKQVERLQAEVVEKEEFEVPKGPGVALGDMPYVPDLLNKRTGKDPLMKTLYYLCFQRIGKYLQVKAHLKQFSGIVYSGTDEENEARREKVITRANKLNVPDVKELLDMLLIQRSAEKVDVKLDKEGFVKLLVDFLENPQPSGISPKKSAPKSARKSAKKKRRSSKGAKKTPAKKKSTKSKKRKSADVNDGSDESDLESDAEDEPPKKAVSAKKRKLSTKSPKKAAPKPKPAAEDTDSDEDMPIGSLKKPEIKMPSDKELKEEMINALEGEDLDTLTLKSIRVKLETHFKVDLGEKKAALKTMLREHVSGS